MTEQHPRVNAHAFWRVATTSRMLTLLVLLTLAAVACGLLGSWQLDRAELRGARAAEEARAAILEAPPVPLGDLLAPGQTFPGDLVGRPVTVTGEFSGEQLFVPGRAHEGEVGFLVLAELRVPAAETEGPARAGPAEGEAATAVLAVVRGWVPDDSVDVPPAPRGTVSVTGHLQVGESSGSGRAPDGSPLPEDQTDAISAAQLASRWGTPIYTGYLVQTEPAPAAPLAQLAPPALPGSGLAWRNLMYALQWWIFGGFAIAIWIRSVRDEARDSVSAIDEDAAAAQDRPRPRA